MASSVTLVVQMKDEASAGFERLSSVIGGIGKIAATVAGVGIAGVAAGLGAATVAGLSFNNQMEGITARLNAFTKDGAATAKILAYIKDEAAQTPFALNEMGDATAALLPIAKSSGIALDDLIKKAEILAASNPAEGLTGAAFALKEAASGDFTSIIERFNLSRQYINQLKDEGVPAMEAVGKAMEQMGLDASLVTNLAQTAQGRWSTFKDTLVGVAAQASKPIFDAFSNGLAKVNDWLSRNQPLLDQVGSTIANGLTRAIELVGPALSSLAQWFGPVVSGFFSIADAILSSEDPIATILDLLDTLIPGFADAAASAYAWGANIVSQLAAGMGAAVDAVISVINTIASIIAYWFAPGSPPKVAPEIDAWGQAAGTEFFKGIANADISPVNGMSKRIGDALSDLSGQVNTALKDMVDIGALGELDRIPALQGFRKQMMDALIEIEDFGSVSETTWQNVVDSLGPVKVSMTPVIRGYLDMAAAQGKVTDAQDTLDQITGKYKKQLDGLNTQLKATQREFDKALRPFNDQLDALDRQEDAIKRVQRAQEAKDTLKDPEATDEEKALARLELQRIEIEKQMAPIEANRDAAVQAIQDQIDATQTQRDAEVAAAQATLDTYQAQLDAATALYQNEQARVQTIQDSNGLLAEQAKLVEQAAKAAAAGGGGGKGGGGGGGGGGLKLPGGAGGLGKGLDLSKIVPEGATGKLAEAGKAIEDVKSKIEAARQTVEGWRTSFGGAITDVSGKWNTFKSALETALPIIAGIAGAFAAFSIISTVAGWVSGLAGAWAAASLAAGEGAGILATIVGILGGPVTLAVVGIAAAVGVLAAAWVGNWGDIQGTVAGVWAMLQPIFAGMGEQLATAAANLAPLGAAFSETFTKLQPILVAVGALLGGVIIGAIGLVVGALPGLAAAFTGAVQIVLGVVNTLLDTVNGMAGIISAVIAGDWAGAWAAAGTMVSNLADDLNTIITGLVNVVFGLIGGLVGGVIGFFQTLYDVIVGHSIVPDMVNGIITWISTLVSTVSGAVSGFIGAVIGYFQQWYTDATTAISNLATSVGSAVGAFVTDALTKIGQLKTDAIQAFTDLVTGAGTKIGELVTTVTTTVANIKKAFTDFIAQGASIGADIINSVKSGVLGAAASLASAAGKVVSDAIARAKQAAKDAYDYVTGGGSSAPASGGASGGGSKKDGFANISRIAKLGPPLDGVTKSMQAMATALTFVADRARQVAVWDTISKKMAVLADDAKTTAAYYKQLGDNVGFLADSISTFKTVEDKDKKGKVIGTHLDPDFIGLTDGELAAFQSEFDKAAAHMKDVQAQFGHEAAEAYFESQSSYLQDEAKLQIAYNQETNADKKAAIKEQMYIRWQQHEEELKALEEEQGAALEAIEAERQAAEQAYNERMAQIQSLFDEQRKANLSGAADLYSAFADTAGTLGDMLASSYQDAYDKAMDGMQPPDPGTLSNADLEKQYADYAAAVKAAEAAGQAAQAQIAQVQQQLATAQQKALEISQIDPQAAADYYALEKDYILQVNDLQQKLNTATTDEQKAAIQQQLDYLAQAHGFNEQLFQANLDQYGQQLADAQQAAQDAADETGDSALQTYANQLAEMFRLFQAQLNSAVVGATGNALGLPGIATMPNLTNRNGFAAGGTQVNVAPGGIVVQINGANKTTKELTDIAERAVTNALQNVANSAARKQR